MLNAPHGTRRPVHPLHWAPLLALALLAAILVAPASPAAHAAGAPIEDYASWQPVKRCSPKAKRGTVALSRWMVRKYGGPRGNISRRCGSTSEHTEGRAYDWPANVNRKADRRRARAFMKRVFATDRRGNPHALARRMGIMYVIWNDRMYAAWNDFEPEPYLSSSCKRRKRCSKTLRHRDHVHVSLTRRGGKGKTSWYARRR